MSFHGPPLEAGNRPLLCQNYRPTPYLADDLRLLNEKLSKKMTVLKNVRHEPFGAAGHARVNTGKFGISTMPRHGLRIYDFPSARALWMYSATHCKAEQLISRT